MIESSTGGADAGVPREEGSPSSVLARERLPSRWRPARVALVVMAVGLVVTAGLAIAARALYDHNEDRLLRLRVRELGLVLSGALPSSQTPLASAVALADATDGNPEKFRAFIAVSAREGRKFASVSLWPLGQANPKPTVVVGSAPQLATRPAQARAVIGKAAHSSQLIVTGFLNSADPSIGYAFATPGVSHGFAVYAENPLPEGRRSSLESNTGFSDLNYALYLGHTQQPSQLLVYDTSHFPITGRRASESVPFGDSAFTLVVTPNASLGGSFFEDLPWLIGALGIVLALTAALMTDRLAHRRRQAEQLAGVLDGIAEANRKMYAEQRGIAQSLQHALLPEQLPALNGLSTSARYVPATSGIDVGGDWYDLVEVDERTVLLVVGDVSGHGLRAATTMASLRYAALAYATSDPTPATILARLSNFANRQHHEYFATVLCASIDVPDRRVTLSSAGHLAPLLIDDEGEGEFVTLEAGVPIGVNRDAPYGSVTVVASARSTLIAFTDGLVERRDETLDTGLARLQAAATAEALALDDLVAKLAADVASDSHSDDTAILAIRWER
ncbi:MAG TPA: PP2C family protein-serine/threonine phosphatase [Solirubrobacteraceae bacterium]|jgi:serine phosphatase RsbU (regulator of sigma subunit)